MTKKTIPKKTIIINGRSVTVKEARALLRDHDSVTFATHKKTLDWVRNNLTANEIRDETTSKTNFKEFWVEESTLKAKLRGMSNKTGTGANPKKGNKTSTTKAPKTGAPPEVPDLSLVAEPTSTSESQALSGFQKNLLASGNTPGQQTSLVADEFGRIEVRSWLVKKDGSKFNTTQKTLQWVRDLQGKFFERFKKKLKEGNWGQGKKKGNLQTFWVEESTLEAIYEEFELAAKEIKPKRPKTADVLATLNSYVESNKTMTDTLAALNESNKTMTTTLVALNESNKTMTDTLAALNETLKNIALAGSGDNKQELSLSKINMAVDKMQSTSEKIEASFEKIMQNTTETLNESLNHKRVIDNVRTILIQSKEVSEGVLDNLKNLKFQNESLRMINIKINQVSDLLDQIRENTES